jgi:predicted RNA-binding protein YlqC (UPF0109 family)
MPALSGKFQNHMEVGMKALIEKMAKSLVDNPEDVSVGEIDGEKTSVYELKVAQDDIGKVIGKQGKTAQAIRTILSAAGNKLGKRCVLEILD